MEQKKLSKEIFNIKQENIEKLQKLFPSVVKDGKLDITALKQELGTFEEVGQEKYEMNWAGKQKAKQMAQQAPLGKTLKYVKGAGVNEDTTENIYIEGDNLEVLKLLRKNYYGSIKMIYIDPPYNTGNDFIYKDNFGITQQQLETAQGQRTQEGEKLQKNTKEGNAKYHTNWLNMIYPRLKLAKDLLTDDGVIFISIDDNEQANLKKICDEIFGNNNFIAHLVWENKEGGGKSDSSFFRKKHEYILCYAKNIENAAIKGLPVEDIDRYRESDEHEKERGKYQLIKLDSGSLGWVASLDYPIELNGHTFYAGGSKEGWENRHKGIHGRADWGWRWRWSKEKLKWGLENDFVVIKQNKSGQWNIYTKQYLNMDKDGNIVSRTLRPIAVIDKWSTTGANKKLKELFDGRTYFEYSKPVDLIKFLSFLCSPIKDTDIILDFFSGSATTAHAVMQQNAEDGGNRKFIMVQLPEPCDEKSEAYKAGYKNICEIGKERIRRAGKKIQEENPDKKTDIGFKVFKVADTTLNWEKAALEGKDLYSDYTPENTDKDKLDFTPGFTDLDVVYEIMLRQEGLLLTSKIEQLTDIGQRTFLVANSYLICLEENITEDIIKKLSELEPLPIKFVFRDSAFNDDIALKDESFRRLSALIDKNKGANKQAYTVEFI